MRSFLILTSCIAASLAAPTAWSPEMAAVYSETSREILKARSNGLLQPPSCDVSKVNITEYLATIPNAPPIKGPGNAKLVQVTLGRGIQNYTCSDNQESTKPVLQGAIANLYNANCFAANYPQLLTLFTPMTVQYNTSLNPDGKLVNLNALRIGHHYFNAAGSPTFDLNDDASNKQGVLVVDGKNPEMKVAAPSTASKGQILALNGQTGAVPWLKLNHVAGSTNGLSDVYRVDTAGGTAPSSCAGQPSLISVEYAAQYWFYQSE